ncbi:ribonuclease H-like domain, reverse transcriptase, RNA-dependent DNA polymerase [Tanacetum coccineum]
MLKVLPWKGVIRFGKHGKLSLRYVGPFKIIDRIGPVAYKLELPDELRGIHNTFHVLNLKKCLADENLIIPLEEIQLDDKLHFIEEPVEIMDREVKQLKQSQIPIVKVRWNSQRGLKFTWEREVYFKSKYPHLFSNKKKTSMKNRAPGWRSRFDVLMDFEMDNRDCFNSVARWAWNEPSGSITNWETLKTKFLNKYCPPARTAKKMEEINNFQQESDKSLFRAWERFKELLMKCPQHYLTEMQEVILFYNGLDVPTRLILDSKGAIPTKAADDAKVNNLGREIKKVNEKVYAAQVRCELCKEPHYTKDCPLKEEGKTIEEAYYTQFGAPYQPGGQYRAAWPGFYQRNNGNFSYPDRRQNLEASLTKFMAESAKRHEENSNITKEIRYSTDVVIRNQGASIKTLEIQIGQMSNVLQERGIGGLPSSIEPNPRDHVKSISTAKADSSVICRIGSGPYVVSDAQYSSLSSETVPFPNRMHGYCCDNWKEAREVKIRESYDHTLPQKEKDIGSFTLPCFIHNNCFDKALVDLGASVSVMPFSTYSNLGLGDLAHTRLTIELADRIIKHPRGIAENVLVRIGKSIFPIDFVILNIPEEDDVPLILE